MILISALIFATDGTRSPIVLITDLDAAAMPLTSVNTSGTLRINRTNRLRLRRPRRRPSPSLSSDRMICEDT